MTDDVTEIEARPAQPSINIVQEMNQSFLDYGYSVVKARALADVRDGLKPVHRRIVYGMEIGGFHASKKHQKSARIVGDVMGKFHPHGDVAIYDALVRLAQPFVMLSPLIDGQGNFGSIDGDPPAAMRYTESRMSRLAHELTADIEKDTVDFQLNYDGQEKEPTVLPARFPNILINGQTGIAVGMAANIPPHNLGEVMDACLFVLDKSDASLDEIMAIMPGPDLPTRGTILGKAGIRQGYETGRGSFTMAGDASFEQMKGSRVRIVITDLPYLTNPTDVVLAIKALVDREKDNNPLVGISDLRDESNRDGIRIAIELKREADENIVLNRIKKDTNLVRKWHLNATCLDSHGKPREMPLLDILGEFVGFRREVVERRTIFDLNKARDELHRQIALYAATSKIDEVIKLIRSSSDTDQARLRLIGMDFPTDGGFAKLLLEADPDITPAKTFKLDPGQADAILGLALRTLTGLEREKIASKASDISSVILGFVEILNNSKVLDAVVRREMEEVKAKYSQPRLTKIEATEHDELLDDDLVERKDIVITITAGGYVKRTDVSVYREQRRGGKGRAGMETKEDDHVVTSIVCTTRTPLLFFTTRGMGLSIKAWQLPDAAPNARGRALVNFLELKHSEAITAVVALPEDKAELAGHNLVFVTNYGTIRRNEATDFANIRLKAGKLGMEIEGDGKLVAVLLLKPEADVLLATRHGKAIRFPVRSLRVSHGRKSDGVKAIELIDDDKIVSACILGHFGTTGAEREAFAAGGTASVRERDANGAAVDRIYTIPAERMAEMQEAEQIVLTVSTFGHGKRVSSHEYRGTARGGKGVVAATVDDETGDLISCFPVSDNDSVVLITDGGQAIRTPVIDISLQHRDARGVRVFRLPAGHRIVSVALVPTEEPS